MSDKKPGYIIRGCINRFLSVIAFLSFPSVFTTNIHRLRGVKIGKGTKINRTAQIDESRPDLVKIGKNVWITAGVIILCHQRDLSTHKKGKSVKENQLIYSGVTIEDGAHIGVGAIILPGVIIGEGAVIGAGAVVPRDIPPYCSAAGVPAKVLRFFN
ncbi:MAG TPA: acyltransferase [Bacteroidales bacterium]|nr:acyltransferase [Bacteroidales bacterium]